MKREIKIADTLIGDDHPCFIIAELGINHNGDLNIAKKLIDAAVLAGCNAVKFQKRTVNVVYSVEELKKPRDNPFGPTNGDLKDGLEFDQSMYEEIDLYCKEKEIIWFASCWDEDSVDFIEKYDPPCYKISSASLTDEHLIRYICKTDKPIIISTGMSSMKQIQQAVDIIGEDNLIIMHCTSTYPSNIKELNLKVIETFLKKFKCPIGYSGHEVGLMTTLAATVLGASIIERHITLDRAMWGSDQAASVEIHGIIRLIKDIRSVEMAMGDGIKIIYDSEVPVMKKLRRIG